MASADDRTQLPVGPPDPERLRQRVERSGELRQARSIADPRRRCPRCFDDLSTIRCRDGERTRPPCGWCPR